ncbi:MAG: HEAT repeat domain-containing protein [Leptospirales bacterium]
MKKVSALVLSLLMISSAILGADSKTVDEYRADLSSDDDQVVMDAATALGLKKAKDAMDDLIVVIKTHDNPQVRIRVADTLGRMGTKEEPTNALNYVIRNDDDNAVVYAALLAILNLGDFGNPSAEEAIDYCEQNKSDDPYIADVVKKLREAIKK